MIPSLAEQYRALGFEPGVDFEVRDDLDERGAYLAQWRSARPQPDAAALAGAARTALAAYAREARRRAEDGGIVVSGIPVDTDDRSKTLILGARARVERDPSLITRWAAPDGHVYPLAADAIMAVSDAVGTFVAECFEAYADVVADLESGTITAAAQIDARFAAIEVAF